MKYVRGFVNHPAPHAILGGACIVVGLAQNTLPLMLLGFWGLVIAIWNYEERL